MRLCEIANCGSKYFSNGLCRFHKGRLDKGVTPLDKPKRNDAKGVACIAQSCGRPAIAMKLCPGHYVRKQVRGRLDWDRPLKLHARTEGMKALRNEGSGENGTARSMRVPMWIWREIQARASDLGVSTEKALTGMLSEYLHQKALDSRRAHSKMDDEHGQPHDFWKQRQSVMEGAL